MTNIIAVQSILMKILMMGWIFLLTTSAAHFHPPSQADTTQSVQQQNFNRDGADYKALYELSKEYNNKILSTVTISLTGIAGLVIALLGFNFWFRHKINEEKVDQIVQKYASDIQKMRNDHKDLIHSEFDEFTEKTKDELEDKNKEKLSNVEKTIDMFGRITDEKIKNLEKHIGENKKDLAKKLDSLDKKLEAEVAKISLDLSEHNAKILKVQKRPQIAMRSYIELAEKAFEIKDSTRTYLALFDIEDTLNKSKFIYEDNRDRLEELLGRLTSASQQEKANDIRSILDEIEVKKREY